MSQRRTYRFALLASLVLHFLFLMLYMPLRGFLVPLEEAAAAAPPLVFEFAEPPKPQELVETPEDARIEKPQKAEFLSDKNARAQDLYAADDLPEGLPYSEGRSEYKTFAGEPQPAQPTAPSARSDAETASAAETSPQDASLQAEAGAPIFRREMSAATGRRFSRELLQGASSAASGSPFTDAENWNNRSSSAEALGGVSLSTYEWDFAPYIFYMKKRIRDHLYPPQAFVQMGAISGRVTLRFTLDRNGTVHNLEFINSEGHRSFIEPSMNAVRASDPFKPLPADFPDDHLELTWTFIYTVY
ncbi:MAG: energy transducer TonB [candidate division KSB1 bacterium]|nr:energy transducer TonB [candidate division KSB1 bacterium]